MKKQQFIDQYVCTFLASYMAGRYDDDCQNGHPNEPYNHQPVEDAEFLAKKAWEQYYDPYTIGINFAIDGRPATDLIAAVENDEDLKIAVKAFDYKMELDKRNDYKD